MLRDAALLQLELNQRALRAKLALKDATPYNVQWRGSKPVFIDVGSFERLRPGEPWVGYRQFCMQFLYPLMLQAYKDLPYHAALRGSLDGISPHERARPARRRALPQGRDVQRASARSAGGTPRRRDGPPGQAGHEARWFQRGAARSQLLQAREACAAAGVEGRRDRLDRLRRGQHVRRCVGRREGRLRARGGHAAEARTGVGRRLQRRPLLPHRGRVRRPRRGVRRRPRAPSTRCTDHWRAARTSCRW